MPSSPSATRARRADSLLLPRHSRGICIDSPHGKNRASPNTFRAIIQWPFRHERQRRPDGRASLSPSRPNFLHRPIPFSPSATRAWRAVSRPQKIKKTHQSSSFLRKHFIPSMRAFPPPSRFPSKPRISSTRTQQFLINGSSPSRSRESRNAIPSPLRPRPLPPRSPVAMRGK